MEVNVVLGVRIIWVEIRRVRDERDESPIVGDGRVGRVRIGAICRFAQRVDADTSGTAGSGIIPIFAEGRYASRVFEGRDARDVAVVDDELPIGRDGVRSARPIDEPVGGARRFTRVVSRQLNSDTKGL